MQKEFRHIKLFVPRLGNVQLGLMILVALRLLTCHRNHSRPICL